MMSGWSVAVRSICFILGGIGAVLGAVFFALSKLSLLKGVFVLVCCALVLDATLACLSVFGHLNEYPEDSQKIARLTEIIKSTGKYGMLVFVIIQILQVVILPLPAVVCYVPGSAIWGPLTATLLASVGVLIGSLTAYALGKFFGKRVVIWIAGKENTEKYVSYIGKRGKFLFVIMQILPFFPDDILCLVAGLTSMNFIFFLATMVIVRPCIIATYCFLGSGTVIPFSGWGIPVWIAIFAVCIVLVILSFKYQDKFEQWLATKFTRQKSANKEQNELTSETASASTETNAYAAQNPDPDINDNSAAPLDG